MNKSSTGYAEGQIRITLADLAKANHGTRANAVKRFQDYIAQSKPELKDYDVMYLFVGDGAKKGFFYYAGIDSGKHGGELRRIAAPAIAKVLV